MTTQQLKTLERSSLARLRLCERLLKQSPLDRELAGLKELAGKDWLSWRQRLHRQLCALAEKKDKGVVLFTIFYPDGDALRSIIRTPHRLILHWETQPWYASTPFEDNVDLRSPDAAAVQRDLEYHTNETRRLSERRSQKQTAA